MHALRSIQAAPAPRGPRPSLPKVRVATSIIPHISAITEWLAQARKGEPGAMERVFEALYPELRRMARTRAAAGERTLTPTVLVHEVYMRMLGSATLALNDRHHFMACAARAMRAVSVDHARRRSALKRGGPGDDVELDAIASIALDLGEDSELIELDAALESLQRFNPRLREIVELHYFAGLQFDAIAELHACSLRTTMRGWARARAFLHAQLATPG